MAPAFASLLATSAALWQFLLVPSLAQLPQFCCSVPVGGDCLQTMAVLSASPHSTSLRVQWSGLWPSLKDTATASERRGGLKLFLLLQQEQAVWRGGPAPAFRCRSTPRERGQSARDSQLPFTALKRDSRANTPAEEWLIWAQSLRQPGLRRHILAGSMWCVMLFT